MNWLAHVYLSEPDLEFRLGNLLADVVKGRDRAAMSPAFLRGVRRHQAIDAFTDTHPIVHNSRARFGGRFPHVTGILVDVFYDHFLAATWERYHPQPLPAFTADLYAAIEAHPIALPAEARTVLDRIMREDRLASYRTLEGIAETLRRLSWHLTERTGREFYLERAVTELVTYYRGFGEDFAAFFPLLQTSAASP